MFSFVGSSFFILLRIFIIAVLIPKNFSIDINYSRPINITYRYDQNNKETLNALIKLQNPLKCMNLAEVKYSSTPKESVNSTSLTDKTQEHMGISLFLVDSYNSSKAYIAFYTGERILVENHILFNFHHSYSRKLDNKHVCLEHCIIYFNIREVFKKFCKSNNQLKHDCCESNESSLSPDHPALDSETRIKKERENNAKTNIRTIFEELVKIDIFSNNNELYYTPGMMYTFKCNATRLPQNTSLQLIVNEPTGNNEITQISVDKTFLEKRMDFSEKHNNSRIYCKINEFKSKEIVLYFLRESTSHEQEKENPLKKLWYIGLILGVLCLSAGVVLYFYFKRKKNNASRGTEVYTYATQQQLMYAQLQLDSSQLHPVPPKNEGISYTTIVGVLKPINKNS